MDESTNYKGIGIFIFACFFVVAAIIAFFMWIIPNYTVWEQGQEGKAALAKADYDRQIKVVESAANLQSQKNNAAAEIARAVGVAQANNIIKGSITDQYIRYLWVNTLKDGQHDQIIYVPTEMGMPITEAGRALQPQPAK